MKTQKSHKIDVDVKKLLTILKALVKQKDIEVVHLAIQSIIEDIEGR